MRRQTELLGSRTRVKERYALIPLEGIPLSRLPEWPDARVQVLAGPALGADFAQYRIELDAGSEGLHPADGEIEHFLYVLEGELALTLLPAASAGAPAEAATEPAGLEAPVRAGAPAAGGAVGEAGAPDLSVPYADAATREHALTAGGYALVPPSVGYLARAGADAVLLLLRKRYEPLGSAGAAGARAVQGDTGAEPDPAEHAARHPGAPGAQAAAAAPRLPTAEFPPVVGNQSEVPAEVYMGDEGALLQSLIPDDFAYDMAMNIFTFQTGHSLPVTETHVMEHGLYVLGGKGLYYLDDTWMEVQASDFIWMGPFCPQSYYATGPEPTRYIYYKNVNREIEL